MLAPQQAPVVRTRRKSRFNDIDAERAIREAAFAWRGTPVPLPIMYRDRILGWMMGSRDGLTTMVVRGELPRELMPFPNYDSYVYTLTQTTIHKMMFFWAKPCDSPVVSNWYDYWPCNGLPSAGNYTGSARTARIFDDTSAGALQHGGDVAPSEKYLTRFSGQAVTVPRSYMLYDRVLDYPACTYSASSQAMTNGVSAARYAAVGQPGLQMCMTCQTTSNATAANLTTLSYDDVDGTTRSMPTTPTISKIVSTTAPTATLPARVVCPATAGETVPRFGPFLPLEVENPAAALVNDYQWSAAPTGTFCLALVFPIAWLADGAVAGTSSDFDYTSGAMRYAARIYDGAALNIMGMVGSTTDTLIHGHIETAWT